ncbi:MAG TPA: transglutaminase domain-containing protein [Anaerolineales bacterium]
MEKKTGWAWDWLSAVLLFMLLQLAAARLVSTDWTPYLYWTETLAGFGAILGLALGSSRFRPAVVVLLSTLYTAVVLPWQISGSATDKLLLDRLNRAGWTLGISLSQFAHQLPVKEPLLFIAFVCLLFWIIGLISGYWLGRHGRVLPAIALGGAAIVITQAYANYQPRGSWWLALFVLLALLLAGRVHFLQQKTEWAHERVFVGEESGANLLMSLFMTASLAILLAWWIPNLPGSVQKAADTWNTYIEPLRERLSNAVTSLQGPYGRPGLNFYGDTLALGQKAAAGDALVFSVKVINSPGLNMRYYWRGRAYNVYQDGQWSASTNARFLADADQRDLGIPDPANRSEGLFQITSQFLNQTLMYGPSPTVWVDRTADVAAVRVAEGTYDTFSWEARSVVPAGSAYQVRAQLRNPTVVELRAAGDAYPTWVEAEYLNVPEDQKEVLQRLAAEITAGSDNSYDRIAAITNYLRDNIEYATSVPTPPEGADPVLWVLTEYKKGFCNYYASAEVLLLRSIGIPARLAVGFARGDLEEGAYSVHRRDAHAWPEVYFPRFGWIEFEPTSSQEALVRPSGEAHDGGTASNPLGDGGLVDQRNQVPEEVEIGTPAGPVPFRLTPVGRALYTTLLSLVALLVFLLAYRLRVLRRLPVLLSRVLETSGGPAPRWLQEWTRWNGLEPVERMFASVGWTLRLLGKALPISATPAIQSAKLARLIPTAAPQIEILREELEAGLFTPRPVNLARARGAAVAVVIAGLRARINKLVDALNGHAVYSDADE